MQTNDRSPLRTARLLGYAGLIPFFAGAVWVWAARDTPAVGFATFALATYAATITAFLGGVHWGPALREGGRDIAALAWGVMPQLAAWLVLLLLPSRLVLAALAALLALCYLVDRRMYVRAGLTEWLPMRLQLTLGAVASCLAGALLPVLR